VSADLGQLAVRLSHLLGEDAVASGHRYGLVVRPASAGHVQIVVRECAAAGVPVSSGYGDPAPDLALVDTSRLRRIIEVDAGNQRAVVEPGVPVAALAVALALDGYRYAAGGATVGDAVAGNHGGVHCRKYGAAARQVTGVELCMPDGQLVWLGGGKAAEAPGYDLAGLVVGAQGSLGIPTKVAVRLLRVPEALVTVLAAFRRGEDAGAAVSAINAAGVDVAALRLVATAGDEPGYPLGAAAVLLADCDGPAAEVEVQVADVELVCRRAGAFAVRSAADERERAEAWRHATAERERVEVRGRPAPAAAQAGARDRDLASMRLVRQAFDPRGLFDPRSDLPAPRRCGQPW